MRFSKEQFNKHATQGFKRVLAPHLDVLDGMEVVFMTDESEIGEIPSYEVDDEEFYLYPVPRSWCTS